MLCARGYLLDRVYSRRVSSNDIIKTFLFHWLLAARFHYVEALSIPVTADMTLRPLWGSKRLLK